MNDDIYIKRNFMKKLIMTESQIKTIKKHLNEVENRSYIFDWDDNILFMPTKIKMDKNEDGSWVPVNVSTEEFAQVRTSPEYRLRNNDPGVAFEDFRLTDSFLHDTVEAIGTKSFAPSFDKFKEALLYGNKFAINTARGHKPEALKMGVKTFIDLVLTDEEEETMVNAIRKNIPQDVPGYQKLKAGTLNNDQIIDLYLEEFGEYYPVSSEEFGDRFGLDTTGGAANPEHAKKVAIEHFTQKVLRNVKKLVDSGHYTKVSIGFSDDDIRNVQASEEFLENELKHLYPEIHFVVYDTSEGGKKKLVIEKD
jgi:hypothetical protein